MPSPFAVRVAAALGAALSVAALAAQTPAPGSSPAKPPAAPPAPVTVPAPTITLLLREPRALAAEPFQKRLARVLAVEVANTASPKGLFVVADGDALVGGSEGLGWRIEMVGKACDLPASAIEHLDEDERERCRSHRAHLRVTATGSLADEAARDVAYRAIAHIAAALLARDVCGIGAAAFGTFEACAGDDAALRADLLGDDPLDALAPVMTSSLVLFLGRERTLDAVELQKRLGAEFGVAFGGPDDDNDEHFVVPQDGFVRVVSGDAMALVQLAAAEPKPAAELQRYEDLRIRRVFGEQKQYLRLYSLGEVGEAAEAARRRFLGRIAAALWGDDVLGLNWHCDATLVPASADVPKQLRSEQPVAATLGEPVSPVLEATDREAMAAAWAKARETWPEALAHLQKGGELSAKFPFARVTKGGIEHIWVTVQSVDGDVVRGVLANEPMDLGDLKLGSKVECKLAELSDWLFLRDGKMVGGYTVKVLEQQAARSKQQGAEKSDEGKDGKKKASAGK
jgi:uncharacterized protein YegJ (DUF2314 family)